MYRDTYNVYFFAEILLKILIFLAIILLIFSSKDRPLWASNQKIIRLTSIIFFRLEYYKYLMGSTRNIITFPEKKASQNEKVIF